jgi:Tol biopolymer transport system component
MALPVATKERFRMQNRFRKSVRLVIGLLAFVVVAIAAPVAGADQIAYSCESDLCIINPDNPSEHRFLTETDDAEGQERTPSWSPDGSLIAYNGFYDAFGSWDVWTLDPSKSADEVEATNISESADRGVESLVQPAWSADGTMLAFAERYSSNAPPNLESEVYVSPADGSADPLAIDSTSNKSELTPAWSPDGSTLLFSREGFLWKGPPNNSTKPTVLTNSYGYRPAVSPDGTRVATVTFSDPEKIRVTKMDGSGFKELPVPADLNSSVDWSPDSTQIVYSADEEPLDRIRVAPADGSGPGHGIDMPTGWVVPYDATFSPDGTRVAFDAFPTTGPGYRQILVAPADGSSPAVPITESAEQNQEPDWKPCEGCAPPPKSPTPVGGGASGGGGGQGTKTPTRVRLAFLKKVYGWRYMTPVFIDCFAQGGHPDPRYCKGDGIAKAVAPRTAFRPWAKAKTGKPVVFAKGSVKVAEGKKKPLKMKITAAGKKLLKAGGTVKVKLSVKVTRPTGKPLTFAKAIKVQAQPGKAG